MEEALPLHILRERYVRIILVLVGLITALELLSLPAPAESPHVVGHLAPACGTGQCKAPRLEDQAVKLAPNLVPLVRPIAPAPASQALARATFAVG